MFDTSVDLDKVVSTYIKIRDKKNELAAEFNKREEELNEKLDVIKKALLEHCQNTGVESIRTQSGTFYRSVKKKYWTSDWESMNQFIMEHEAIDLLEKRIHQGNMRQFLDENQDLLPPGLNVDSEYTITVRRKK
jgi:predicted HicB family RNase H-like nuclease